MAITMTAKPAAAVYRYTWAVPVVSGDSVASVILTPTGCVVDSYQIDTADVTLFVSGGTSGQTASIAAAATTNDGETIVETLYIAITGPAAALKPTGRDVCLFALRKFTGNGEEPTADELADALERLSAMLAEWKDRQVDVGVALPVLETDILYVRDSFVSAIKANLYLEICEFYGGQPTQLDLRRAQTGLAVIKAALKPVPVVEYY